MRASWARIVAGALLAGAIVSCGGSTRDKDGTGSVDGGGAPAGGDVGTGGIASGGISGHAGTAASGGDSAGGRGGDGAGGRGGDSAGGRGGDGAAGRGGASGSSGGSGATDAGATSCEYGGVTRDAGTTFYATDGCNTCSCGAEAQVSCTKKACPPCDSSMEDHHRGYIGKSPMECSTIRYKCPANTTLFTNDCGCGCEQLATCPEFFDCEPSPDSPPCDTQALMMQCPYSGIAF